MDWIRLCHRKDKNIDIPWDRQIYHYECLIEYERILHSSEPLYLIKILSDMKNDGEYIYKEKQKKIGYEISNILDEIFNEK